MRHRVSGYKLGRNTAHRTALFRNLAAALFQHGQITTTLPKAKAVQPFVEKLITLAKKGDLAARRQAVAKLQDRQLITVVKGGQSEEVDDKSLIQKLFDEIGPRFADRPGGYTRIVRLSTHRIGDGGEQVVLQLVGEDEERPKPRASSHRRQAADARTAFAAKALKGGKDEPAEEEAAVATEEPPAEEAVTDEAPAEEAATEEAPAEEEEKTEE